MEEKKWISLSSKPNLTKQFYQKFGKYGLEEPRTECDTNCRFHPLYISPRSLMQGIVQVYFSRTVFFHILIFQVRLLWRFFLSFVSLRLPSGFFISCWKIANFYAFQEKLSKMYYHASQQWDISEWRNHLLFWFNKFIFCFKYLYPALFQEDFKAAGMFTAQISAQ